MIWFKKKDKYVSEEQVDRTQVSLIETKVDKYRYEVSEKDIEFLLRDLWEGKVLNEYWDATDHRFGHTDEGLVSDAEFLNGVAANLNTQGQRRMNEIVKSLLCLRRCLQITINKVKVEEDEPESSNE